MEKKKNRFYYWVICGLCTLGISVWSGDMASADKFPEVLRKLQIIYACGALTFSSMPGVIADMTGGYIPAYILFSILIFLSLIHISHRQVGRNGHDKPVCHGDSCDEGKGSWSRHREVAEAWGRVLARRSFRRGQCFGWKTC